MDFVTHLPQTFSGHDRIWVIVDRLTKSAHFLAMNLRTSMAKLAQLYIKENCKTAWSTFEHCIG